MRNIYTSAEQLIGNTPLLELCQIEKKYGLSASLFAKLEYLNPAGSAKDRVAKAMLDDAEARGLLKPGSVIIEPTSGNTGIGLACVAASRGYRVIIVMPDTMSMERRLIMKAYGAELVLSDGSRGMAAAIEKANELAQEIPDSFIPGQFENPANAQAHFNTTGPEIWRDTDGKVDIFVAGVGTGGTLCGTSRQLKTLNPRLQAIAVEPAESPLLTGGTPSPHGIQGIGANFVPQNYDSTVVDHIIQVSTEQAMHVARELSHHEGLIVGISSGAAIHAALQLALTPEAKGKCIVAVLPDTGERYLSTGMF